MSQKCTATSKSSGKQCGNYAEPGTTICRWHGARAPQVRDAAARRLLQAKINGELQQQGWEPVVDPLAAYADLAGEIMTFKALAREHVNQLSSWSYQDAIAREDAKAVVGVYERALDRCDKILASMVKFGIDAAMLRQARERPTREQAAQLVEILGRALGDPRVTVNGSVQAVILDALGDLAP